jgi:HK97 family phage major capsid protein
LDPRLVRDAPTSTSVEGTGADGVYLVPPDYSTQILNRVFGEDSLLSYCDRHVTPSNQFVIAANEAAPWSTDGPQAYWTGENSQLTQSKVALKEKNIKLNKLTALIPVSSELMEDAPSLNAHLSKTVPEKFVSKLNLAIVQGTGVGEPQGILNCPSLVTVDKESAQSADTLDFSNIVNQYSRMYAPLRRNAIWICNQDIEPQLFELAWEGTSSSVPAYLPANAPLANTPGPTLMGRPVVATQACETLGDLGDLIFAAFSEYLVAMKSEGLKQEISIHLWFDWDVVAYRFIMRLGGQCWWSAAISGRDTGTSSLGAFVALEART